MARKLRPPKTLLEKLLRGQGVELGHVITQKGERIPTAVLWFRSGSYRLESITCRSSQWLDLGNCACCGHEPLQVHTISRNEALELLDKLRSEMKLRTAVAELESELLKRMENSL